MRKERHYTIPFFIIHRGCPNQCVFCDQKSISGHDPVRPGSIRSSIERYLDTIPSGRRIVEVGFFGGSFTSLEVEYQRELLREAGVFLKNGKINGIRLSTRPDSITETGLDILSDGGVKCIELGVQSMNDSVLEGCMRGHTSEDVVKASEMIISRGFRLGHQMMVGLPGSSFADEVRTAFSSCELGASDIRIYPLLVMRNTPLAEMYHAGKYVPLSDEDAVERSALLMALFISRGRTVIRCGLHPSSEILNGKGMIAGPFHPAFGFRCESRMFGLILEKFAAGSRKADRFLINPSDRPAFTGHKKENVPMIRAVSRGGGAAPVTADPRIPRYSLSVKAGEDEIILTCGDITPVLEEENKRGRRP